MQTIEIITVQTRTETPEEHLAWAKAEVNRRRQAREQKLAEWKAEVNRRREARG